MSENGNGTKASLWTEVPRQQAQKRCHECSKRTFYWLFEREGAICSDCVNLRNMPKPPVKTEPVGVNVQAKKSRSTIAPTVKNAILVKRASGQSKLSIAKEMHVAPGTVRKVLTEADFDQLIQQGRSDVMELVPDAIQGIKKACAKGDGSTAIRLLEGVSVLGPKPRKLPSDPALTLAIQNLMGNVTLQVASAEKAINAEVISTNSSSPSSSHTT